MKSSSQQNTCRQAAGSSKQNLVLGALVWGQSSHQTGNLTSMAHHRHCAKEFDCCTNESPVHSPSELTTPFTAAAFCTALRSA